MFWAWACAAYLTFHRRTNAVFAEFELTADQFVLLTASNEVDCATQKDLMPEPTLTQTLSVRCSADWSDAALSHVDGTLPTGAWSVSLTDAGWTMQRRAMDASATIRESWRTTSRQTTCRSYSACSRESPGTWMPSSFLSTTNRRARRLSM